MVQGVTSIREQSRIHKATILLFIRERSRIIIAMAKKTKNPYAVALGRKGGRKGGPARAANMTPEQRSESARNAVVSRWARVKESKVGSNASERKSNARDKD